MIRYTTYVTQPLEIIKLPPSSFTSTSFPPLFHTVSFPAPEKLRISAAFIELHRGKTLKSLHSTAKRATKEDFRIYTLNRSLLNDKELMHLCINCRTNEKTIHLRKLLNVFFRLIVIYLSSSNFTLFYNYLKLRNFIKLSTF